VLSLGGNNLTNDIAIGLRAPLAEAEKIKKEYGTCTSVRIRPDEYIEVPSMGGRKPRKLARQVLAEILEPRAEEIFTLVQQEISRTRMGHLINSGIVLTGGTSMLDGMTDVAESVFDLPTRLGKPINIGGLVDVVNNPMYATGVGLVLYGAKNQNKRKIGRIRDANIFNRIMNRMKRWFKDIV
jgi:cell division protein FtsA